jgi:integrase
MTALEEKLLAELAEARAQTARLADVVSQLAAGSMAKKPSITIRELFARFEASHSSAYSWVVIRNRLRPLVRRLGDLPASELTAAVWSVHRSARMKESFGLTAQKEPRYPKVRTLNHELDKTKQLLYFGVRAGLLEKNPLVGLRGEKCRRGRETYLDEASLQALLARLNPFMQAFVLICADTGLRFNECRKLQRDWIRPSGAILLPGKITKTRRPRTVVMTERARAALAKLPEMECTPHIFVNRRRRRGQAEPTVGLISERQIRRWFYEACAAAGIDARAAEGDIRIRVHDLRHTAATAALRRGATIVAVQRLLGHTNIAITSRYLHSDDAELAQVARLMESGAAREGRVA